MTACTRGFWSIPHWAAKVTITLNYRQHLSRTVPMRATSETQHGTPAEEFLKKRGKRGANLLRTLGSSKSKHLGRKLRAPTVQATTAQIDFPSKFGVFVQA